MSAALWQISVKLSKYCPTFKIERYIVDEFSAFCIRTVNLFEKSLSATHRESFLCLRITLACDLIPPRFRTIA